jgi:hypothetical protein
VLRGQAWVLDAEQVVVSEAAHRVGEGVEHAAGRAFVVVPRDVGEAFGLADDQPPQADDRSAKDRARERAPDGPKVSLDVLGLGEDGGCLGRELLSYGDGFGQGFSKQLLLAAEDVVDRPFGYPRFRGDVVHAGPDVPDALEVSSCRRHDGLTRTCDAGVQRCATGRGCLSRGGPHQTPSLPSMLGTDKDIITPTRILLHS